MNNFNNLDDSLATPAPSQRASAKAEGPAKANAGQPLVQFYTPEFEQPPAQGLNKLAVGLAAVGVLAAGYGLFRGLSGGESAPRQAEAAPIVNMMSEQQQMMREAMNMAREAQQMQRERMDMLRQQMMEGESAPGRLLEPGSDR